MKGVRYGAGPPESTRGRNWVCDAHHVLLRHWLAAAGGSLAQETEVSWNGHLLGEQHQLEGGNTLVVAVRRHQRQVTLEGSGGNEGVYIADQTRTVWRPELSADLGVAFKDGVGQCVRVHGTQETSKLGAALLEAGKALQVLHHLGVDQATRGSLAARNPRADQGDGLWAVVQIGSER
jgi:hypothetical protein